MAIDHTLGLEAVYYSAPVPRDLAVLTVLGIVFDKVHLPGVYIPMDGYDRDGVVAEIERLRALNSRLQSTADLIGMMKFMLIAPGIQDMLVLDSDHTRLIDDKAPGTLVDELYRAIHGPHKPGWTPAFDSSHHKGLPGTEDSLSYRGEYHYMAGALLHSAEKGIPLINDLPGLPVPGVGSARDADALAAMIAIESVLVSLPDLPLLTPVELMEFRAENQKALRGFRGSMLKYASQLRGQLKGLNDKEVQEALTFFVKTEIVPALDELRSVMERPAQPWYKRAREVGKIVVQLGGAVVAGKEGNLALAALSAFAPQVITELMASSDKNEQLKRSGLYYLLKLRAATDR